jgi:ATP-dependent Clp protease ATP-binding subunit ClpA
MMLSGLSERIRATGIDIVFDDSLAPYIAEQSAKERCGARNIRHIITSCVENKLALRFFDGTLKSAEPIVFSKKDAI